MTRTRSTNSFAPLAVTVLAASVAFGCASEEKAPLTGDARSTREASEPDGFLHDVTETSGIDFVHRTGARGGLHLPEIVAGGVALADFDDDGDLDAYFSNGSFALDGGVDDLTTNRLFVQRSDGRFVDATAVSGLGDAGYGLGIALGDVDNDGDRDVYLSNFGPDRLYENLGGGRFRDGTADAGIEVDGFSCSVVFCDYDLDGWLDAYVTRYVVYEPDRKCADSAGRADYCNPRAYTPRPDVLLRNEGGGRFRDVSREAGPGSVAAAGLGVICQDLNGDGLPDFYVANDQYANHLWLNRGDGTFREAAVVSGAAYNHEGEAEAGMGVVAADFDDDLDLDLFMTHLRGESNTLYRNLGAGSFEDATIASGLMQSSLAFTGFGTVAADFDLDGDLDLAVANGRVLRGAVDDGTTLPDPWNAYAEPNLYYRNEGAGRFIAATAEGRDFTEPVEVSRGLAVGDVDADGDLDLLLTNADGRARLYHNRRAANGSWLAVRALDPRLGGRDVLGARITLEGPGWRSMRTVSGGFGYLSSSEPAAHFGVAKGRRVDRIAVRWPDGVEESFEPGALDRLVRLERGQGRTTP